MTMAYPIVRSLQTYGEECPRCHLARVVRLRCMASYSPLHWFKCEGCDHIFTRQDESSAPAAAAGADALLPSN
jgi:transposase-like protein